MCSSLTLLSPNPDTSFMYMIAGLCMLKLYQKRHPDINASAYSAYACLAIVIFFSVLGVVRPWPAVPAAHAPRIPSLRCLPWASPESLSPAAREEGWAGGAALLGASSALPAAAPRQVFGKGNTAFWIVFSVIHITATLLLSTQLYYMGRWKLGEGPPGAGRGGRGSRAPRRRGRWPRGPALTTDFGFCPLAGGPGRITVGGIG